MVITISLFDLGTTQVIERSFQNSRAKSNNNMREFCGPASATLTKGEEDGICLVDSLYTELSHCYVEGKEILRGGR